ncbi:MAG: hypothetical protein J4203_06485 [Candidatus Diapherotrites archaeon]|uniref:Integral membrane protein n=1 Tax=Candidatus Iainarchaeum sp. TaxID=3101447 RepID=A0A8T4L9U8_9ARCH|nr:hypothetical protein [Candidatus Diapherotrites archaeon]
MFQALMNASGFFWSLAYLLIIWRGFKDQTYGMPLFALCANLSWEFIFSFLYPPAAPQLYINVAWLFLDVFIALEFLKFGRNEFPRLSPQQFYACFVLVLLTAFGLVLLVSQEFHDFDGVYAAFGQNLVMSMLFVAMLLNRGNLRGQSASIAVLKLLGTAAASLAFYLYKPVAQESILLPFLFASILGWDLLYAGLVYSFSRKTSGFGASTVP